MAKCIEGKYTNKSYVGASNATLFVPAGTVGADLANGDGALLIKGEGAVQVAPEGGWRLTKLRLINVDTPAKKVSIYMGALYSSSHLLGVISVPITAGFDGATPACDALNTTLFPDMMVDNAGNKYIDIPEGQCLFLTCETASKVKAHAELYDYVA